MSDSKKFDRYQMLFDRSADAMLIIDNNCFIGCNQAALTMLGYVSREELFSIHPSQLSPPVQQDGKRSLEKADQMITIALENGSHRFEWVHRRANGEDFPVDVLLTPIESEERILIHVTWRDITDQKRAEERLRLAKYVIDNTSEGVVVTDLKPRIIDVNPAYCEILGYDKAEVIGADPGFSKAERHDKDFYQRMWQAIESTGKWSGELWDRKKNGEVFPKHVKINTIRDEHGAARYYVGVFSDISQVKKTERRLEEMAFTDPLTHLPNRILYGEKLKQELATSKRRNTRLGVLFIDLDRFKHVNDTLGHAAGDELLTIVAKRLRDSVREMDTVARMGGDEFTVIVTDVRQENAIAELVEKLIQALQVPIALAGQEVVIGASIGISIYPDDGETEEQLTQNADVAMYDAKARGRNVYGFFSQAMESRSRNRLQLEKDLRQAIENNDFCLHYQPQIDIATGNVLGVEALVRWQHPRRGLVAPLEFIPLAEATGLIIPLGRKILYAACVQAQKWLALSAKPFYLSVNLSCRQFQSASLVGDVSACLEQSGLAANLLRLEVTEAAIAENVEQALDTLNRLRAMGLSIAIDDFGTGYSSLTQVKDLPVDCLKIDRSFICDLLTSKNDAAIVETITVLGRNLGLDVIVEGVEDPQQLSLVRQMGCQIIQGYYYSRPLGPEAFLCRYLPSVAPSSGT